MSNFEFEVNFIDDVRKVMLVMSYDKNYNPALFATGVTGNSRRP